MKTNEILHKLRNSHGLSFHDMRIVRLEAADEIEKWKDAFENMQQWARDSGLDTATYGKQQKEYTSETALMRH